MRRNSILSFLKEKSFIIVLTLMLVSAGTMAALFAFGEKDQADGGQTARQEEALPDTSTENLARADEIPKEENAVSLPKTTIVNKTTDTKETKKEDTSAGIENADMEAELEDQYLEAEEMAEASAGDVIAEGFMDSRSPSLQWPVEGEVIMPFSMDKSIYFATLAQYQYNPAMIIAAEEGTEVLTCAAGTVTEVGKSSEYGHYVTMDLGDGFVITYGQLFDISTEAGEKLEAGERIAKVAYPTRNYLEEGDNLYLKLTKNGVSVDPKIYLEK